MRENPTRFIAVACFLGLLGCSSGERDPAANLGTAAQAVASALTAEVSLESDWGSGYVANVVVHNHGTVGITSWSVALDLQGSSISGSPWRAVVSGTSGSVVTFGNETYDGTIPPGGSEAFGFVGVVDSVPYRPIVAGVESGDDSGTGTSTTMPFEVPSSVGISGFVIAGREGVEIADRAVVHGPSQRIVSMGSGGIRVGVEAQVPDLWSLNGILLANYSTVNGSAELGAAVVKGEGVTISGDIVTINEQPEYVSTNIVVRFDDCSNDVLLPPGVDNGLAPGAYGHVSVHRGALLQLYPGMYSMNSLTVEPGGTLAIFSDGPSTVVAVRDNLVLRGPMDFSGEQSSVRFLVAGSDVTLEQAVVADIVAPNARVTLTTDNGFMTGSIYGRWVHVAPNRVVTYQLCSSLPGLPGEVVRPTKADLGLPTTAGTPPSLTDSSVPVGARADSFIRWLARATRSDLKSARLVLAQARPLQDVAVALVARTQEAISDHDTMLALVGLEALAELNVQESEELFASVVTEPGPSDGAWNDAKMMPANAAAHEACQIRSVDGLGWLRTDTAKALLLQVAAGHPSGRVRAEAIRVYLIYYGGEGRAELAGVVQAADQVLLDRIDSMNRGGRSWDDLLAEYQAKHPVSFPPAEPTKSIDSDAICVASEKGGLP